MNASVTSLAEHAAAKERERIAKLDQDIIARAAHIRSQMDTVQLDADSQRVLRENRWELYR